ncbi:hypothetical protein NP233_g12115 [Leucocoprinus birnbaumii]|uniref:Uncharacterized protein n=1 Tax=Leucocoprinus birnbaumii TaxID=56174 RepID=A0AAD5YKQ5_9AGAR|nr:hypothetical protein NP233_g12115 [Leucocoprinus birnbaumii]
MADSRWNNSESSKDEKGGEDAALDRQGEDRNERGGQEEETNRLPRRTWAHTESAGVGDDDRQLVPAHKQKYLLSARYGKHVMNHSRITRRLVDIHPTSPPPGPQAPVLSTRATSTTSMTTPPTSSATTSIPPCRINILFPCADADQEIQQDRSLITSRSVPSPAYGL